MNVGDERSRSLWMDVDVAPSTSKLTQDTECDTVVIGSGIAGLSTAYETPAELLARTGSHAAKLIGDLTRQRDSLAAADASHLPAGVSAAEGVALL